MPLRWFVLASFFAMIFFGLFLPSDGNHGLLSPKSLSFLASASCWILSIFLHRRYSGKNLGLLIVSFSVFAVLLAWIFLGILYGETPFSSQFDQFKLFLITLIVVAMTLYYVQTDILRPEQLYRCAIYTNFIYCGAKSLGALLHVTGLMNILTFMQKTGIRFMSMDIHAGVIRLQTSVDIVTPYLLLFVLNSDRLGIHFSKKFRYIYTTVALLSILLSFSRYLIVVSWIALFLYWITAKPLSQLSGGVVAVFILVMGMSAIGPENAYKVIEKRLFSLDNYYSDQTRVEQVSALSTEVACYPLLGKGIGGYAPDCIRDPSFFHSYEVQWVAFTMQLGFVGVACLLTAFIAIGWPYFVPPYTMVKMTFGAMYALWLLSGFTNPFLISLTSGIMYSLFACAALTLNTRSAYLSQGQV